MKCDIRDCDKCAVMEISCTVMSVPAMVGRLFVCMPHVSYTLRRLADQNDEIEQTLKGTP